MDDLGDLILPPEPCEDCDGTGTDLDGSTCPACKGDKSMVRFNGPLLAKALRDRGLNPEDPLNVAAELNLGNLFGLDWRSFLRVAPDVPASTVFEKVARALLAAEDAETYLTHFHHGTGPFK